METVVINKNANLNIGCLIFTAYVSDEKSFVEPLKIITDKMGWLIDTSYGTQGSLEDFF